MIIFVDMEHDRLCLEKPSYWMNLCARRMMTKNRLETISGEPCLLLGYGKFSPDLIKRLEPSLVVFSGNNTDFSHYDPECIQTIQSYFLNPSYPTFCICGSFQLMAQAFGSDIGPIGNETGPEPAFEDPIIPNSAIHENGVCSIEFNLAESNLFDLPCPTAKVYQHHFWEVKNVPTGFRNLASSEVSQIQAIQHDALPIAGVQFHPEEYDKTYPDGKAILETVYHWASKLCA